MNKRLLNTAMSTLLVLTACEDITGTAVEKEKAIPIAKGQVTVVSEEKVNAPIGTENLISVNYDNYNQAETARNFNNWARLGGNNTMLHLKSLSPIGNKAPTIRMNLDTLYSVGVYDNNGEMTITIPESGLYQSIMILDTDGYTPFFLSAPGVYPIKHKSETLFVAVRTVVKDRYSEDSFKEAFAAQEGIKVEGNGSDKYVMPAYDQEQLHALTVEYNKKMLESGVAFTYGDGITPVNEEHRTWSNAAGWGGMALEVGVSNYYTTSENLPSDVCYAVTFPETGNKFFTSFTIYDTDGYLMDGNSHINSYTWKSDDDGSTTIHFNCSGKENNITSNGKEFNYIVRSYGASQKIIDEVINPVKPQPVSGSALTPSKYSAKVPASLLTPDSYQSKYVGELTFVDGFPTEDTLEKAYDFLDTSRAVQLFEAGMPTASMYAMLNGHAEIGFKANKTIGITEQLMNARTLFLTPQTTTPYVITEVDVKNGPVVIEVGVPVIGLINDAYFKYVADIGMGGQDKGKGGQYLLVGNDYKGEIPEGYFVLKTNTYRHWLLMRVVAKPGQNDQTIAAFKQTFKMYPLAQAAKPEPNEFVNLSNKQYNTIHATDATYYDELNAVIQYEPANSGDPEMLGLAAAIGIKKGQPFKPDTRMQKILTEAAALGNAAGRAVMYKPRNKEVYFYPDRQWYSPLASGSHEFLDKNGARALDERIGMHFYATGITPFMTKPQVGAGSVYEIAATDAAGNMLNGGLNYRVTLPAPIPAKNFWSFMVYDNQTRSILETDQKTGGLDSNAKGLKMNKDGSATIYFGPEVPKGHKGNWVQTMPNKGYNVLLRLYGPLQAWFDKTWMPGDFELVK